MNSPSANPLLSREQQLAKVREWIAADKGREYKKRDKRRYVRLCLGSQCVTMDTNSAEDWISDSDGDTYEMQEVWITTKQFESLPEFEGF